MPYLRKVTEAASAALTVTELDKPAGGRIVIRYIGINSWKDLKFGAHRGWLENISTTADTKGLFNKIVPQTKSYVSILFEGERDWPEGFKLRLAVTTQTALEALAYSIFYEVVEPPKKGWWP